jgi:DNA-binding GntR family transcriptional regulator
MRIEPVQQAQLWQTVAERLRAAIIAGDLQPGTKLVEASLAKQFEISRGPIREAIRDLARDGLVMELPRRGTVVSTLDIHDLIEVYAVREALEVAACRVIIRNSTESEIGDLELPLLALEATEDHLESVTHDLAFHGALVGLAGNSRAQAINQQMLNQTMVLLRTAAEVDAAHRTKATPAAHRDILTALIGRETAQAEIAVASHYRYAEERVFGALEGKNAMDQVGP